MTLIDVGAAGGIQPRWSNVTRHVNYVGFEPGEASYGALRVEASGYRSYRVLPHALGKRTEQAILNCCRESGASSIFLPDRGFLGRFPRSSRFDIVEKVPVCLHALDDYGFTEADFLKIDVQGAELAVLEGATSTLLELVGVEVEVEFIPLYVGQPLFGDVSEFLRICGFEFIDFINLCRWEREAHNSYGQCVFGDALFLRTPESMRLSQTSPEKLDAYLGVLLLYGRHDLMKATADLLDPKEFGERDEFFHHAEKLGRLQAFSRQVHQVVNYFVSLGNPSTRAHLTY